MKSSPHTGLVLDPLEWLHSLAATGDTVGGAEGMAAPVSPGLAAGMGETDPTWAFTGEDHAQATSQAVGEVCKNHCPINKRCVEGRCRFYRLEQEAERYLAEGGIE